MDVGVNLPGHRQTNLREARLQEDMPDRVLQGHLFLFEKVGLPFFASSTERLEGLEFVRVEVEGVYEAIGADGAPTAMSSTNTL